MGDAAAIDPPGANRLPPIVILMISKRGDEAPGVRCGLSTMQLNKYGKGKASVKALGSLGYDICNAEG
eukprot:scaffold3454_cov101-Cyclotella_meneghiniana.AAC.3